MFEMAFNLKEESECIKNSVEKSLQKGIITEDLTQNNEKAYKTNDIGDFIKNQILS
jgi:3-isopropylmalate dehydrogenase